MLDLVCPGWPIKLNLGEIAVVGGRQHSVNTLITGEFVQVGDAVVFQPPNHWTGDDFEPKSPANPNGGQHLLVEVAQGTDEFNRIEAKLKASVPNAVVSKVQRVQNRILRIYYETAKNSIELENNGVANEIEGWHGTGSTDPTLICCDSKSGFDVNRSAIWIDHL